MGNCISSSLQAQQFQSPWRFTPTETSAGCASSLHVSSLLGIGTGVGENRAQMAARAAVSSPLLDLSIEGARGVLFNIAGGKDLTMFEVDEAAKIISAAADQDANIIFGAVVKEDLSDQARITVIAIGFDETRSRIAQMSPSYKPVVQGVVSEGKAIGDLTNEEKIEAKDAVSSDYNEDDNSGSDDDTFGDKFEIPAFLRKIH